MNRPVDLAADGKPDAAELAAAHLYSLAMNHGFIDGNKRAAWVATRVFLADHGCTLEFDHQARFVWWKAWRQVVLMRLSFPPGFIHDYEAEYA